MIERRARAEFSTQLRRRRGRPRSVVPSTVITVRVPQDLYDELCRLASRQREPLPVLVRAAIASTLSRGHSLTLPDAGA